MKQKPNSRRKRKSIKPMELTPILRQFLVADGASGQISNELRFFLSHFLLRLTSQDLRREAELLRPETKTNWKRITHLAYSSFRDVVRRLAVIIDDTEVYRLGPQIEMRARPNNSTQAGL